MSLPVKKIFLLGLLASLLCLANPLPARELPQQTPPGTLVRLPAEQVQSLTPNDIPSTTTMVQGKTERWIAIPLENPPKKLVIEHPDGARSTVKLTQDHYPTNRLTLADTGSVQLSDTDLRRHRREADQLERLMGQDTEKKWSIPFTFPFQETTESLNSFGERRIINDVPKSPHSGEDYVVEGGTPVRAINHGTVRLTEELFFAGKAVVIDHGDKILSHYYHLESYNVETGEVVDRGDVIGTVGESGRTTGPHLHLGVSLQGAMVDPKLFFEDPIGYRPQ